MWLSLLENTGPMPNFENSALQSSLAYFNTIKYKCVLFCNINIPGIQDVEQTETGSRLLLGLYYSHQLW